MSILNLTKWVPQWLIPGGSASDRRVVGIQVTDTGLTSSVSITSDKALQLSAIWACTKIISETVSSMPINFYKIKPDGSRELDNNFHLYTTLNNQPNRWQTGIEFNTTISISETIRGNSYSLKQFSPSGKIIGLIPLMASQMEVKLLDDGSKVFIYHEGNDVLAYSEKSIWHTMAMPGNAIVGLSPLSYAARSLGIATAAEERVAVMAQNGFKPTGVLMCDKILNDKQRDQLRKEFSTLSEGSKDPLKVLEAGMTYQQVSLSPKDAQLLESRQYSVEELCRFWGVPSVLVNDTSASTSWGSGIEQLVQGFYKLTIRPILERREASIRQHLMTPQERVSYAPEYDFSALIRSDDATRIGMARNMVTGGLMTINEARRWLYNLSPVAGGDEIYLQQQMTPIEQLEELMKVSK